MEYDFDACLQDSAVAASTLARQHVERADDPTTAAISLATCLMFQAEKVLKACYGDAAKAREHLRLTYAKEVS